MSRPKNNRFVKEPPIFTDFKPIGIRGKNLERVYLSIDEYEAIRLADEIGLSHEQAANEMKISRSTFSRLILKSRNKIADFIVNGKALSIEGGKFYFINNIFKCNDCGDLFKTKIKDNPYNCPNCNSNNIENIANKFNFGQGNNKKNNG